MRGRTGSLEHEALCPSHGKPAEVAGSRASPFDSEQHPQFSAHRGGSERKSGEDNSLRAIRAHSNACANFIEIDVQRTADGEFILQHSDRVRLNRTTRVTFQELTLEEIELAVGPQIRLIDGLRQIRIAGKKAHIDLKFWPLTTHWLLEELPEVSVARQAYAIFHPAEVILTSAEDESVARLKSWGRTSQTPIWVGLSIGRYCLHDVPKRYRWLWRILELHPKRRIEATRADFLAIHHRLARLGGLRLARNMNLPALVWTVDSPGGLSHFQRDERVSVIVTNYPVRASPHIGLRSESWASLAKRSGWGIPSSVLDHFAGRGTVSR